MNPETFFDNFGLLADTPNGVQKLRELILQLAVQGKLVPQDANDEPTKLNHQQISFALPYGWLMCKLDDVLEVQNGFAFKSKLFTESSEGIPLIRIRNLKNSNTSIYYTGEYSKEFLVNVDDYLIGMDGDFEIHKWNGAIGLLNQRVCRLKNFSQDVDPEYILYSIQEKLDEIHANTSFVTVKHLSSKKIKAICLPMPPLEEQRRIVAKVDQLMALCDELEARQQKKEESRLHLNSAALDRLLTAHAPDEFAHHWQRICDNFDLLYDAPETVGELRKAILQLAVQGKLVAQDADDEPAAVLLEKIREEKERLIKEKKIRKPKPLPPVEMDKILFEIPESWEWLRFGDVTFNRDGERIPVSKEERSTLEKIYDYYGASGIIDKIDNYLFDKPLLLIGEDGANLINRSTPIAFIAKGKYWVNNHAHVLDGISLDFLRYLEIFINATDLTPYVTGTAQPKMNQTKMNSIPLALPPFQEQKRIVAKVDQLMALCDELESKIEQSQTDGTNLMEAVVGELTGV